MRAYEMQFTKLRIRNEFIMKMYETALKEVGKSNR
jgi:hypothetical protein